MTLNEYQKLQMRTAPALTDDQYLVNASLGLCGECAEAYSLFAETYFGGKEFDLEHMLEEVGDILWYISLAARALGTDLGEIELRETEVLVNEYILLGSLRGLQIAIGNFADHVKKYTFQGHSLNKDYLIELLGNMLYNMYQTAYGLGTTLDEIGEQNIEKLRKRYPDGFDAGRSVNR